MRKTVLIAAGEISGDIHASALIENLKKLNPELDFFGIGGKRMEASGINLVERMDKHSIVGVWEAIVKLWDIGKIYKKIMAAVLRKKPVAAILIDYPGFNLTLARSLKKKGIRVVYYITPQVWAWGASRIRLIKKYVDKAIVILKFEEDLFKKHGIDAAFVGHPLLDRKPQNACPDRKSLNLAEAKFTVALLPGSRESEVKKMLPVMLKTSLLMLKKGGVQFVLLKNSGVEENIYTEITAKSGFSPAALKDNTYGCLALADFVFTSSGTATLESAIMEKPMLITYRTSFLTAFLFKFFARTRFIGLVNIIAKKEIAPEVLQYDARPEKLAAEITSFILSPEKLKKQLHDIRQVKSLLGTPGASLRAARIIKRLIG